MNLGLMSPCCAISSMRRHCGNHIVYLLSRLDWQRAVAPIICHAGIICYARIMCFKTLRPLSRGLHQFRTVQKFGTRFKSSCRQDLTLENDDLDEGEPTQTSRIICYASIICYGGRGGSGSKGSCYGTSEGAFSRQKRSQ